MSRNGDPGEQSRNGDPDSTERTIERLAHALTPAEWSGTSLAVGIVVLATVLTVTVVQRAMVADSTVEWVITSIHGLIVVAIVPLLSVRAVSQWRERRAAASKA